MRTHFFGSVALVVLGVVVLGCGGGAERDSSGQIVEEGNVGVFDFQIGDCFQDPEDVPEEGIPEVDGVPCSDPHDNEVYFLYDLSERFDDWPGEAPVAEVAEQVCLDEFEPFVGRDFQSSRLNYVWIVPSEKTWNENDDYEVVCALFDNDQARLTGTMRSSGE